MTVTVTVTLFWFMNDWGLVTTTRCSSHGHGHSHGHVIFIHEWLRTATPNRLALWNSEAGDDNLVFIKSFVTVFDVHECAGFTPHVTVTIINHPWPWHLVPGVRHYVTVQSPIYMPCAYSGSHVLSRLRVRLIYYGNSTAREMPPGQLAY